TGAAAAVVVLVVVGEPQRVDAAVALEALPRVRGVVFRVRVDDRGDYLARELALVGAEVGDRHAVEAAVAPLHADADLRGRARHARRGAPRGSERRHEPVRRLHLIAVHVARQADPPVAALIAVDLRPAECGAVGAGAAQAQVQVHTGQQGLARPAARVAAD